MWWYLHHLRQLIETKSNGLYRGGGDTVGKQQFTALYSVARNTAFTEKNVKAAWSKSGLVPFHPERVLRDMHQPKLESGPAINEQAVRGAPAADDLLSTPVTADGFLALRRKIEQESHHLDPNQKYRLEKLANAAEKAIADRGLLLEEENSTLMDQNREKMVRSSIQATMVGQAKILCYEDIVEAQKKREAQDGKEELQEKARSRRRSARKYVVCY